METLNIITNPQAVDTGCMVYLLIGLIVGILLYLKEYQLIRSYSFLFRLGRGYLVVIFWPWYVIRLVMVGDQFTILHDPFRILYWVWLDVKGE